MKLMQVTLFQFLNNFRGKSIQLSTMAGIRVESRITCSSSHPHLVPARMSAEIFTVSRGSAPSTPKLRHGHELLHIIRDLTLCCGSTRSYMVFQIPAVQVKLKV